LGIEVRQEASDNVSPSFDAFLTYIEVPEDPDQYAIWHSTQFGNVSGYKSPRVDRLLEEGRQILDKERRKAIYLNFQRALTEDVPAAFLFYPKIYSVSRN
jgi:peptide/nickel transport system substrate-binding protein